MPPRPRHNPLFSLSSLTPHSSSSPSSICLLAQSRRFSATPQAPAQRSERPGPGQSQRTLFFNWINGPGEVFKQPDETGPKYVSSFDKYTWERKDAQMEGRLVSPYPQNKAFKSQPVLSDETREEIYQRVQIQGHSVRQVSADLAVSLERVAAVVRLKAVEKEWVDNGKHISTYLTAALERMLPLTNLPSRAHENIQDLPAHRFASRQAFVPTSESREYTRVDAGKEFGLPPADEAVPHPELILTKRERIQMLSDAEVNERREERDRIAHDLREAKKAKALEKARSEKVVEQGRWKWRLQEARAGHVGFRYGFPHPDRKKGHVKIPTYVA